MERVPPGKLAFGTLDAADTGNQAAHLRAR
jgi:hypothetical protein